MWRRDVWYICADVSEGTTAAKVKNSICSNNRVRRFQQNVHMYQTTRRRQKTVDIILQLFRHAQSFFIYIRTNVAIIQRYQSNLLLIITNAPWYVTNQTLHSDLRVQSVQSVRDEHTSKHRSTLEHHPNPIVKPLILHTHQTRRLKRRWTFDATNWGVVTGHIPRPPWKCQLMSW